MPMASGITVVDKSLPLRDFIYASVDFLALRFLPRSRVEPNKLMIAKTNPSVRETKDTHVPRSM